MKREFTALESSPEAPYDVLVIGGGIQGVWTAYDCALRGLKVALVEKNDWAAGTSSSSSKLIHGGLRYLAQFEFSLVKHALHERSRLLRLAPHRVKPLRFLMPVYKGDKAGRFQLKMAFWLYDRLAGKKGKIGKHLRMNKDTAASLHPWLQREGLKGAYWHYDGQEDDARFVLELVDGAMQAGVAAVNHVAAIEVLLEDGKAVGAEVQDELTGDVQKIYAKTVVNACGPWMESLIPAAAKARAGKRYTRLVKGSHLLMPPIPSKDAVMLTSPDDDRVMFLIPWYGHSILGTTDSDYSGNPDDLKVTQDEVLYMLRAANKTLGDRQWTQADIRGCYVGARTLEYSDDENPTDVSRDWELLEPVPNMLMPVGGKYTTGRHDGEAIADKICDLLDREQKCQTEDRLFPWAPEESWPDWRKAKLQKMADLGIAGDIAEELVERYGNRLNAVLDIIVEKPVLASRVDGNIPFCQAELIYAVRHEMAVTLEDVLRRRVPVLLLSMPEETKIQEYAGLVADELGWDERRKQAEVGNITSRYPCLELS